MADHTFAIGDRVIIHPGAHASDGITASDGIAEVIEPLDEDGDVLLAYVGTDEITWVLPSFLTLARDVQEDAMTEHVQPELPFEDRDPHPESLERMDPYINKRFLALMGDEANADISRALTMGLAINDPERPQPAPQARPSRPSRENLPEPIQRLLEGLDEDVEVVELDPVDFGWTRAAQRGPVVPGQPIALGHYENRNPNVLSGVDHDGDEFRVAYVTSNCEEHGPEAALVLRATPGGFMLPMAELPKLIEWMQARLRGYQAGQP